MMPTTCPHCGCTNVRGAQFCVEPSCGSYLGWDAEDPGRPGPDDERVGGRMELADAQLEAAPGRTVTTMVTVHNAGTTVERFHVAVAGDARPWARVDPVEVVAYPGDSVSCAVGFAPPLPPAGHAGTVWFEVRADSTVHPGFRLTATGELTVGRTEGLTVDLSPRTTTGATRTTHVVRLDNQGNDVAQVRLDVSDAAAELRFDVPAGVAAAPGIVEVPLTVRARPPFLGSPRDVPFQVVATPQGGRPVSGSGTRVVTPRLRLWQLIALIVLFLVLVVGLVALVAGLSADEPAYYPPDYHGQGLTAHAPAGAPDA